MKMTELAISYRNSAEAIRNRLAVLRQLYKSDKLPEMERYRMRIRIATLYTIMRETNATANYLEHYYDRREI